MYALFFDIDGTLVSFKTHQVPESTVEALTLAKEKGSKVYISTGRPTKIITNLHAIEHLIDGYITINGAYCYVGKEVVCCHPIPEKEVDIILEDARRKNKACMVVGETDIILYNYQPIVHEIFYEQLDVKNLNPHLTLEDIKGQKILQCTFAGIHSLQISRLRKQTREKAFLPWPPTKDLTFAIPWHLEMEATTSPFSSKRGSALP